jgi:hypothetical protein
LNLNEFPGWVCVLNASFVSTPGKAGVSQKEELSAPQEMTKMKEKFSITISELRRLLNDSILHLDNQLKVVNILHVD